MSFKLYIKITGLKLEHNPPLLGDVLGVSPRNAFVASSKETCLFACDYSQNEVRILAHMSGDQSLISLFAQPGTIDIYKQMSSVITGKSVASVSSKERSIAKQITLAIIYGMGINNVAKKLSISKGTAQTFFQSFYGRFRGVKVWMEKVKEFARKEKYVTTITGRRRYDHIFVSMMAKRMISFSDFSFVVLDTWII